MSSDWRRAIVVCAAWLTLQPWPVRAQQPEKNPTAQEKETARLLLDKGRANEAAGRIDDALASFRAAHEIMGVPTTGIYLSKALAKSGRLIESRDVALTCSRAARLPQERPERTSAREQCAKLVTELGPRIPTVSILVQPRDAPGLVVMVDKQALPLSVLGQPWAVDPGDHTITISAAGYVDQSRSLRVVERQAQRVDVQLVPGPSAAAPPVAQAPVLDESGLSTSWILAIVGLSAGGASLAAGAVTGSLSLTKTQSIQERCAGTSCPPSLRADADEAQTLATVSNVTLAVGGALAAGGVVAMALALSEDGEPAPRASVFLRPGFVGVGGSF